MYGILSGKGGPVMNISLNVIRYFVEAAKQENFSKAANRLYTAQPNLSKRIAELEKAIGVKLFQRTGKQVHLTQAGRHLYEQWSSALEQIERSLRQAQLMEQEQQDTLKLGILEGMSVDADASRRLDDLHDRCPDVQVHMERAGMHQLFQEFEAGRYDLIVVSELHGSSPVLTSGYNRRVVETCCGAIAINTKNPIAGHDSLTLPMLGGESFIALSREEVPQGYRELQEVCRRYGFEPRIIREAHSIETLLLYVEMGAGIALLSENTRLVSDPNIRLIPLSDLLFDTVIYWRSGPVRPALRTLISVIDQ